MSWTCEQVEAKLSEYVDGLLTQVDRAELEAHARVCAQCAPAVSSVADLVRSLHDLEPLQEPPLLVAHILDRTLGPRRAKWSWRGVVGRFEWLRQPRLAYGVACVAMSLAVVLPALGFSWRAPKLRDLNPVNMYRAANRETHLLYARGSKFVSDLRVVYEIQTRLRPETGISLEPESAPPDGIKPRAPQGLSGAPDPDPARRQNRVNQFAPRPVVIAHAFCEAGERSLL
jgi:anti-sigma factor RsiW